MALRGTRLAVRRPNVPSAQSHASRVPRYVRTVPGTLPRGTSVGHADLIPEAAVEVELVAVRLARAVVADIGVQGVAVVGRLHRVTAPGDRAQPARVAWAGSGHADDRRPVGGA